MQTAQLNKHVTCCVNNFKAYFWYKPSFLTVTDTVVLNFLISVVFMIKEKTRQNYPERVKQDNRRPNLTGWLFNDDEFLYMIKIQI